jgi:hypothetical protein
MKLGLFREDMTPIQCAMMTLFAERNKLRREFMFSAVFEEGEQPLKRVKQ